MACGGETRRPVFGDVVLDVVRGRILEDGGGGFLSTFCDEDGDVATATCELGPGVLFVVTTTAGADNGNDDDNCGSNGMF